MTDMIDNPSPQNIRKVGEEFIFKDVKLVTMQSGICTGCYFQRCCKTEYFWSHGFCDQAFREDKTSVFFKKVKS